MPEIEIAFPGGPDDAFPGAPTGGGGILAPRDNPDIAFPGGGDDAFPGGPTDGVPVSVLIPPPVFDELLFPTDISQGAAGGPVFSTNVIVSNGGRETRNRNWRRARHQFDVSHATIDESLAYDLFDFFLQRQGRARAFRFKWWRDFSTDQPTAGTMYPTIALSTTLFQLQKIYASGGVSYSRIITKPVIASVTLYDLSGTLIVGGYTVDTTSGQVSFDAAPGFTPQARFEFDIPVRFDVDSMQILDNGITGDWQQIPLIEIVLQSVGAGSAPLTSFCEVQFPKILSDGASGGPKFSTTIIGAESGAETRVAKWPRGRHTFDVSHALREVDTAGILAAFFYARGGRHQGFRFYYWRDYSTDQPTPDVLHATLQVTTSIFQLQKLYGSTYLRKITKPVDGTVHIYNGAVEVLTGWTVDTTTGRVTFADPPGYVPNAKFEFDIPVRFDTDQMKMIDVDTGVYSWEQIPIVEILNDDNTIPTGGSDTYDEHPGVGFEDLEEVAM